VDFALKTVAALDGLILASLSGRKCYALPVTNLGLFAARQSVDIAGRLSELRPAQTADALAWCAPILSSFDLPGRLVIACRYRVISLGFADRDPGMTRPEATMSSKLRSNGSAGVELTTSGRSLVARSSGSPEAQS